METHEEPKYTMYVKVQTHKHMQMAPSFQERKFSGMCI